MPFFSIIIPVYNVEQYLKDCVQSILNQTFEAFEIILVDDGSKDSSGAICDALAQEDCRIKVIHKPNGGLSDARNAGHPAAAGSYIIYLDSDDYWLSDTVLESLFRRIGQTEPDVLIYNLRKDFEGRLTAPYFPEAVQIPVDCADSRQLIFDNRLWTACAWNKAVKSQLYERHDLDFRLGIIAEDVDWCCRLALCAQRLDFLNLDVVGYRQRVSSITGSTTPAKVSCLIGNIDTCLKLIEAASAGEKQQLLGYLAYQYCTLLHGYSLLKASGEKKTLWPSVRRLQHLLSHGSDPKVALIRRAKKIVGLRLTLKLLALRAYAAAHKNKRSD